MSMSDDDDRALTHLLADPSVWLEPDAELETSVVAAIRAQRPAPSATVTALPARRRRWSTHVAAALLGAAAAAVIAVAIERSEPYVGDDQPVAADANVQLIGTDLAPGFIGAAAVTTESSGVLVRLTMPGLPRREGDAFYEGWLKSCDGQRLVPIGTFHDMDRAAGWAGVAVDDYPLLTVTAEWAAGPDDVKQGSSGEVVARATISPCPES